MYLELNEIRDYALEVCYRIGILGYTENIKITEYEDLLSYNLKILVRDTPEKLSFAAYNNLKFLIGTFFYSISVIIEKEDNSDGPGIIRIDNGVLVDNTSLLEYKYELNIINKINSDGTSKTEVNIIDPHTPDGKVLLHEEVKTILTKIKNYYGITADNMLSVGQSLDNNRRNGVSKDQGEGKSIEKLYWDN